MPSRQEVNKQIRQSLGLTPKHESAPTLPQEGHAAEFPYWSFSKKRCSATHLHISYEDGSFATIRTPAGMPSPSFAGYLDCILFYGQHDLFEREVVEISIYKILKTLDIDTNNGRAYSHVIRDMDRAFQMSVKTDRFRDPVTGQRTHVEYFHVLRRMRIAKRRQGVSRFFFDSLFLESLRSGYLRRLDWDYCLWLDKRGEALSRFLYGHVSKRLGNKSMYQRNLLGFIHDVGLGYLDDSPVKKRNQRVRQFLYPSLDMLRGKVFQHWEYDLGTGNLIFIK